jgi:hypothetical protein
MKEKIEAKDPPPKKNQRFYNPHSTNGKSSQKK